MANMDNTARERDALCLVLSLNSTDVSTDVRKVVCLSGHSWVLGDGGGRRQRCSSDGLDYIGRRVMQILEFSS